MGFIDKRSEGIELAVFDAEGKIVSSKKRQGEGPEDYQSSALAMGFSPAGDVFVQTSLELVKYDLKFNRISKSSLGGRQLRLFNLGHGLSLFL